LSNHKKVIPFRRVGTSEDEPVLWQFYDYAESGNDVHAWYEGLSEDGQDIFDALLKANANTLLPIHWQGSKMLQGKYKEHALWEWCFFADGAQQRLVGIFGDERKRAIFLIGCYHKQKIYKPSNCLDLAITRCKIVRLGKATLNAHTVPTDF
jgi:hypothetical protein